MNLNRVLSYARKCRPKFLSELKEFVRFPSVSSQPQRHDDVKRCAVWLARHLRDIGLENPRVIATGGNPIVYASWTRQKTGPTLIVYGHYDVVAPEPLSQWQTPPFKPTVRGNDLFARGASDDKGQLFCHVKAIESFLASARRMPVNVKCVFEGEEEIGSTHLPPFIERNRRALSADAAVISDTKMLAPNKPAISYAQRGGLRIELEVTGPVRELHSGTFGGAVLNPIQAAGEIIARLHDDNGRVAIHGFYDDVRDWSEKERDSMARSGPSDDALLRQAKVQRGWGESGYTMYERTTIRPALTINGICGGHCRKGSKGVIPERAVVKMSFRLVPDQSPDKVGELFREYIARIAPPEVQVRVKISSAIQPALIDRHHPAVQTAAVAYQKGFGAAPVFVRSGGSIPAVNAFQELLGVPAVLMGFGLPDDRVHAPNEKLHLPDFYRGIETSIWYMSLVAKTLSRSRVEEPMHEFAGWRA